MRAIASYDRTQVSFDCPFDHIIGGDQNAIDDSAKLGWEIFNKRGRFPGPNLTPAVVFQPSRVMISA